MVVFSVCLSHISAEKHLVSVPEKTKVSKLESVIAEKLGIAEKIERLTVQTVKEDCLEKYFASDVTEENASLWEDIVVLSEPERTLGSYDWVDAGGRVLRILVTTESRTVFVKTLTGKTIPVDTKFKQTVRDLARGIQKQEGIPVNSMRMIFNGQQLNLDSSLEFYNIQKESTVHLVLRLRGAGTPESDDPSKMLGNSDKPDSLPLPTSSRQVDNDLVYFAGYAPPRVQPGRMFLLNIWAYTKQALGEVIKQEKSKGREERGVKGPLRISHGSRIEIKLESAIFPCSNSTDVIEWEGIESNSSFELKCMEKTKHGTYVVNAHIKVDDVPRARLLCEIVVGDKLESNPNVKSANGMNQGVDSKASTTSGICCCIAPALNDEPPTTLAAIRDVDDKNEKQATETTDAGGDHLDEKISTVAQSTFMILPRNKAPHIFLSYRRTYIDLADRIRMVLSRYGYKCFLDLASSGGLGAGSFSQQLEENLKAAPIVIPILTPAPSGRDEWRQQLSSLELVKEAAAKGVTDWVHEELKFVLKNKDKHKIITVHREPGLNLMSEFKQLPQDVRGLKDETHLKLHDDLFEQSIEEIHKQIQSYLLQLEQS